VGLDHLAAHLNETDAWERRLSGGEQQRLALSRALLLRPDWLFLDQATVNLNPNAEEHFYKLLRRTLPDTTLVSIAHHEGVAKFHSRTLRLDDGALHFS